MLNSVQCGFLTIMKAAITKEAAPLPEDFPLVEAYRLAAKQNMISLFYSGMQTVQAKIPAELLQAVAQGAGKELYVQQSQAFALEQICTAFEAAGIDYMPMKGSVLRDLYPQPHMRFMCDIDILIHPEQYDAISAVMQAAGFTEEKKNDPEMVWKRHTVSVELHKQLFATCNLDFNRYYEDGWCKAVRVGESHRFAMKPEDTLIFLITHLAKHYRNGGIEVRNLMDIFVYRNAYPEMDHDYLRQELNRLKLLTFYENVNQAIACWFDNAPWEPVAERIVQTALFGSQEKWKAHVLADAVRDRAAGEQTGSVRGKRLRELIFLPYRHMCLKYPILKKVPILLPVFWIVRLCHAALFRRKRVRAFSGEVALLSQENIETYHDGLKQVGLDFNF